jgi:hypoxanthine phosphoribosyltransferase|tara:strand:+ start:2435 stop:2965 length:531 start_codon:yes stop_codon:yes gene_type:complete
LENIKYKNHNFKKYLTENDIFERINELAEILNKSYKGKNPIIVGVLNGCVFFMMDLLKKCNFDYEISFISAKSYKGNKRGKLSVEEVDESFRDRDIIIVEDIIDSGHTIKEIYSRFSSMNPISLKVITLLNKNIAKDIDMIDCLTAFDIENKFVIGYGLDYNNLFRNLKDIYIDNE